MRVLVVTVVHTPHDARIHHRQIRALRDAGVAVTQIAPFSATGTDPAAGVAGVRAVDVPRAVGRHRLAALRAARRRIARLAPDHDLVLLHDPELVLAVAGRLRRLPPVVLDVHEDLVAALVDDRPWIPTPLRPLARLAARRLERASEDHLAGLLLAEASYQQRFRRDHPVVPNLPWLPVDPPPAGTEPRVVYVGRLSVGRGAHELIAVGDALRAADVRRGAQGPAIHLEVAGAADADVLPALRAANDRGALVWHGYLPNDRAMALVRGSIAGLSLLHDLPNYRGSMPTKVVEYLAHGVPAITTPLPEAVALVRAADAGVVVEVGDVDATVAAIRRFADDAEVRLRAGAAGRAYVRTHRSWDARTDAFVTHLQRVAAVDRP